MSIPRIRRLLVHVWISRASEHPMGCELSWNRQMRPQLSVKVQNSNGAAYSAALWKKLDRKHLKAPRRTWREPAKEGWRESRELAPRRCPNRLAFFCFGSVSYWSGLYLLLLRLVLLINRYLSENVIKDSPEVLAYLFPFYSKALSIFPCS